MILERAWSKAEQRVALTGEDVTLLKVQLDSAFNNRSVALADATFLLGTEIGRHLARIEESRKKG